MYQKGKVSFKKCPTPVRRGTTPGTPTDVCISHLFLRKQQNEVLEKMLDVTDPRIIVMSANLFRCRSFSERPIERPEKAGRQIHAGLRSQI
ncbi:MAG: hypothetical protein DME50_16335 [Verrucomicrobia bacterium]|nr:MAG: hypothetical protein DME50_16335 [Verrucomicrobiota bacterium]